jgi:hypothetical protein
MDGLHKPGLASGKIEHKSVHNPSRKGMRVQSHGSPLPVLLEFIIAPATSGESPNRRIVKLVDKEEGQSAKVLNRHPMETVDKGSKKSLRDTTYLLTSFFIEGRKIRAENDLPCEERAARTPDLNFIIIAKSR